MAVGQLVEWVADSSNGSTRKGQPRQECRTELHDERNSYQREVLDCKPGLLTVKSIVRFKARGEDEVFMTNDSTFNLCYGMTEIITK